jgi:hypothetical protein
MKLIFFYLFLLFCFFAKAQQYTNFQGYGFKANRLWADSVSIQANDTLRNKAARSLAVIGKQIFIADGSKWALASAEPVDTFTISTRNWNFGEQNQPTYQ